MNLKETFNTELLPIKREIAIDNVMAVPNLPR